MLDNNYKFHGIWPVLNTPYKEDLTIDLDHYRNMIEWYIEKGVDGIYANCQSSEMFLLNDEERMTLVSEAVKVVAGRVPVAATGNFGDTVEEHIKQAKKVESAGPDVIMLTVPPFCANDDDLRAYYMEMAKCIESPLGLYECPVPRSYHLGIELIELLAKSGRFYIYKETSCDLEKIKKILKVTSNTSLSLLQANIPFMLEAIKAGAPGSMNIAANWLPDLVVKVAKGNPDNVEIQELNKVLCSMEMVQRSINAIGIKYLLSKRGVTIRPLTRHNHTLSSEARYSLDQMASLWFREDGNLKILNGKEGMKEHLLNK